MFDEKLLILQKLRVTQCVYTEFDACSKITILGLLLPNKEIRPLATASESLIAFSFPRLFPRHVLLQASKFSRQFLVRVQDEDDLELLVAD